MASSTIKNNELKSSTDYGKLSTRYSTSMRWPCARWARSEEHTSELQSQSNLVCRLLLEKKKNHIDVLYHHSKRLSEVRRGPVIPDPTITTRTSSDEFSTGDGPTACQEVSLSTSTALGHA